MKTRVNYAAVAVAVVMNMIIGMAWFGAMGDKWSSLVGKSMAELQAGGPTPYIYSLITSILIAMVYAYILPRLGAYRFMDGVKWGFIINIVFVFAHTIMNYSYAMRPMELALIDGLYPVISGSLMAGVVAAWRPKNAMSGAQARTA